MTSITDEELIAELDRLTAKTGKLRDWFARYRDHAAATVVLDELADDVTALASKLRSSGPGCPTVGDVVAGPEPVT